MNKINWNIEGNNGSKDLTILPDKNKDKIEKNQEVYNKIKYLCESENNDPGKYNNKYTKTALNLDYTFLLKQEPTMHNVVTIIGSVFMIRINNIQYF